MSRLTPLGREGQPMLGNFNNFETLGAADVGGWFVECGVSGKSSISLFSDSDSLSISSSVVSDDLLHSTAWCAFSLVQKHKRFLSRWHKYPEKQDLVSADHAID